ncbi:MAG: hypothetical protein K8S97_05705 [Anaerolineae bacterium]|nr:hypothetical protein [Anaerolineae bacterium]
MLRGRRPCALFRDDATKVRVARRLHDAADRLDWGRARRKSGARHSGLERSGGLRKHAVPFATAPSVVEDCWPASRQRLAR